MLHFSWRFYFWVKKETRKNQLKAEMYMGFISHKFDKNWLKMFARFLNICSVYDSWIFTSASSDLRHISDSKHIFGKRAGSWQMTGKLRRFSTAKWRRFIMYHKLLFWKKTIVEYYQLFALTVLLFAFVFVFVFIAFFVTS